MKVNYEWVKQQFVAAGVRQQVGDAVLELLRTWEKFDLPANMADDTRDVFTRLANSESLIKTPIEETWVQAVSGGQTMKGDVVRVKHNAFKGEVGVVHNGRIGRVTGIRSGDVIFRSTDGLEPFLDNSHYPFTALEKRVLP